MKADDTKVRIDQLLVERGIVPTREKAQALILAGQVLIDETLCTKAGHKLTREVADECNIRLKDEIQQYVSRGALKLKGAVESFGLGDWLKGKSGMDVGASTGGFTEILLECGACKVFAVDVGTNQLDYKIRSDSRVVVLEQTNARTLHYDQIGQKVDAIVMDVSFISIRKIIPALLAFAHAETRWILLIKPQFEAGPELVPTGGVIQDEGVRKSVVDSVCLDLETLGLERLGLIESPIRGQKGNVEFLSLWRIKP